MISTVSTDCPDFASWLRVRRARVAHAATELAERAQGQRRTFSPREQAWFDELSDALDHLDAKIRQAWIDDRADPDWTGGRRVRIDDHADPGRIGGRDVGGRTGGRDVGGWLRDDAGGSFSAAPGSGSRATLGRWLRR
jgi:hypothetical protein